jgi:hypothetical protein
MSAFEGKADIGDLASVSEGVFYGIRGEDDG